MDGPVVLVDAESDVERGLVTEWLRTHDVHPRDLLPIDAKALTRPLADLADDVPITPVRVAWLPREREGRRRVRWSDVVSLDAVRRPPASVQARIVRREPDRARVVAGAQPRRSASCAAAMARPGGHAGFAAFVARQATLALERAERGLVGDHYKVPRLIAEAIEDSPEYRSDVAELAARLELPEAEVARRAAADLAGLVASMSPMAVDLLTGALRPLHARAWNVAGRRSRAGAAAGAQPQPPAGVPAQPPQLRRPAAARRRARRPRLPAQPRARRRQPELLAGRPAGQAGRAWCSSAAASATTRSTSSPSASTSATCWPSGSTWSGTWRAAARAPASCARRATGCWPTSPRRSSRAASTTSTSCRCRSPTTSCARCRRWPPSRSGRRRRARGVAWLARYARAQLEPLGSAYVRFAEPISLRDALAGEPDRRLALQKVAFEVCVGINRVTPVVATALVTLALLGVRDRALTLAQVRQVLGPVRSYLEERGLVGAVGPLSTDTGLRRVLGALERSQGRHDLRGRRGAGVRDRARPAPRRGVLPQLRDPPLRRPRDRRAGAARRARGPLGRRVRPCATCSSSSSSSPTATPTAPSSPPSCARMGAGWDTPDGPAVLAGARVPHRPPGAALVRRRPARGGAAAGRPQPAHPRRREGVPRRVRRRRAADAPAGTAARAGVAVARAVRQRAEARRQPRPRRRGPRGARQAARGVRRAAANGWWPTCAASTSSA